MTQLCYYTRKVGMRERFSVFADLCVFARNAVLDIAGLVSRKDAKIRKKRKSAEHPQLLHSLSAGALTAFEALVDNARQARNDQRIRMTSVNSQTNNDPSGGGRSSFFRFSFFRFSAAATAEEIGV